MPGRNDCCGARWGTSFDAKRWRVLDVCGTVCLGLSLGVHVYATTVSGFFLIPYSLFAQIIYFAIYIPLTVLAVTSLYMAWSTDPGAVPMGARPLTTVKKAPESEEGGDQLSNNSIKKKTRAIRRCPRCNDNYKPPRAHHDSVTGRCVVKMDHFCPWVCNVVGAMNHKFFVLFVGYTLVCCLLTLVLIVLRFIRCGFVVSDSSDDPYPSNSNNSSSPQEANWHSNSSGENPNRRFMSEEGSTFVYPGCDGLYSNYWVIGLLVVAVVFMIFTCCMLCEQLEAIETNTGKIARMKLKIGQGGTELERVTHECNEMFGGRTKEVAWHWFLPLPVRYPDGLEKVILGYEWDPTFGDEPYQENDMVAAITRTSPLDKNNKNNPDDAAIDSMETGSTSDSGGETFVTTAKKRGRKPEDNPVFVGKTKDRLT